LLKHLTLPEIPVSAGALEEYHTPDRACQEKPLLAVGSDGTNETTAIELRLARRHWALACQWHSYAAWQGVLSNRHAAETPYMESCVEHALRACEHERRAGL
jgi:hypothetical protein